MPGRGSSIMRPTTVRLSNSLPGLPAYWDTNGTDAGRGPAADLRPPPPRTAGIQPPEVMDRKVPCPARSGPHEGVTYASTGCGVRLARGHAGRANVPGGSGVVGGTAGGGGAVLRTGAGGGRGTGPAGGDDAAAAAQERRVRAVRALGGVPQGDLPDGGQQARLRLLERAARGREAP